MRGLSSLGSLPPALFPRCRGRWWGRGGSGGGGPPPAWLLCCAQLVRPLQETMADALPAKRAISTCGNNTLEKKPKVGRPLADVDHAVRLCLGKQVSHAEALRQQNVLNAACNKKPATASALVRGIKAEEAARLAQELKQAKALAKGIRRAKNATVVEHLGLFFKLGDRGLGRVNSAKTHAYPNEKGDETTRCVRACVHSFCTLLMSVNVCARTRVHSFGAQLQPVPHAGVATTTKRCASWRKRRCTSMLNTRPRSQWRASPILRRGMPALVRASRTAARLQRRSTVFPSAKCSFPNASRTQCSRRLERERTFSAQRFVDLRCV